LWLVTGTYIFIGAVFGLILGSFLNVVVYRTPRHLSVVRPGSFCPTCNTELASRDNVPVLGWLWLGGKCRYCREPISARYPIVEAATAAVFVGIAITVRPLWGVPGWWAMAASIGVVAVIEADRQTCPWGVPLIGTALGAVALAVGALLSHHLGPAGPAAIGFGVATVGALLLSASKLVRENFGTAALWCLPAVGACYGWLGLTQRNDGWPDIVGFIFITSISAAFRKRSPWDHVPFATALAVGLFATTLTAALTAKG
jgi:leader peptidase (prepilin peptidase)/N-methyltransferase